MAQAHLDKTLTSLVGEFFVAGHLCLRGYYASLTLKNYPKVDVFCLNPKNGKQVAIQVKTIRKGHKYFVPKHANVTNNPFVFVRIKADNSVEFFIVPSKDLEMLVKKGQDAFTEDHPNASKNQPGMVSVKKLASYQGEWNLLGLE